MKKSLFGLLVICGLFIFDIAQADITTVGLSGDATIDNSGVVSVVDGLTNVVLTTSDTNAVESPEKKQIYTFNNYATAGTAVGYTLPTAAAGKQRCYGNYTGKTGVITVNTSASGQYISVDGVLTASGGNITSGGALGDKACFVGVDATHWVFYGNKGAWTAH
jgi:phage baseplate assembly protein gpV